MGFGGLSFVLVIETNLTVIVRLVFRNSKVCVEECGFVWVETLGVGDLELVECGC